MRSCDLTAISDKLSLARFPKERKSSHLPENPWHSTLRHSCYCCCNSSAIYKENHECHRLYQLSDSFEIQKRKIAFSSIEVLAMKNPVQVPLKNSMFLSLSLSLSLSLAAEEEGTGLTFSQEVVLKGLQILWIAKSVT
jgi:hypothetical protein